MKPVGCGRALLGLFVAMLALAPPARAHGPPARVWINGEDIDGPPPHPRIIPGGFGVSVWPASVSATVDSNGPTGAVSGATKSSTANNFTLFAARGLFQFEVDALGVELTNSSDIQFGTPVFRSGAFLTITDVAVRGWRQMHAWPTPYGQYKLDLGLRLTNAKRELSDGVSNTSGTQFILSPEVCLRGHSVLSENWLFNSRFSYASNFSSANGERTLEFKADLDYAFWNTVDNAQYITLGVRYLRSDIGFTDQNGGLATFHVTAVGPEIAYRREF
jgi:hypothetical protein